MPHGDLTKKGSCKALDDFTDPESGRSVVKLKQVHQVKWTATASSSPWA